jgi:hypothetical protein
MTNDELNPNDEARNRDLFVIHASTFLRHSSFVLRHFSRAGVPHTRNLLTPPSG